MNPQFRRMVDETSLDILERTYGLLAYLMTHCNFGSNPQVVEAILDIEKAIIFKGGTI